MTRSVDNKGAVVFTLPSGGKEMVFSGHDALAEQIATLYARKKWGLRVRMDKGSLVFKPNLGESSTENFKIGKCKMQNGLFSVGLGHF